MEKELQALIKDLSQMSKELQAIVKEQKDSYVGNYLNLICKKKYGHEWSDEKSLIEITLHLKYHYPKIFEALYEHSYQKVEKFLNDDGTGNELCENWEEEL